MRGKLKSYLNFLILLSMLVICKKIFGMILIINFEDINRN